MKKFFVILGVLVGSVVAGRADITLNEGQSYTHEFHIPALEPSFGEIWTPNAHFHFWVVPDSMDPEVDEVIVEAFESSTNEVPFFTRTASAAASLGETVGGSPVHWSGDLQGVVRIRVIHGSVVLRSVSHGLISRTGPRTFGGYEHTQPVPIPPPQPPPPVVVNEGESFTHEFHIPLLLPLDGPFWVPNTHFSFWEMPGTYDPAVDEVVIEAFENSTNEVPYYSSAGLQADTIPSPTGRWSDLQGVIRLRVIKGSVTLESLSYGLIARGPFPGLSSYNNTVFLPIPEVRVRRSAAGQIGVRWPAGFEEWVLESAPSPSRNVSWTTVPAPRVRLGDDWSVLVPATAPQEFFRLRRIVEPVIVPH